MRADSQIPPETGSGEVELLGLRHLPIVMDILLDAADRAAQLGSATWTFEELRSCPFRDWVQREQLFGWIEGSQVLACCLVQEEDQLHWPEAKWGEALYLHKLAVRSRASGRAIGEALVSFANDLAFERQRPMLRLDTIPGSKLVSYYERLGFVADPNGPATFGTRWLLRMERRTGTGLRSVMSEPAI